MDPPFVITMVGDETVVLVVVSGLFRLTLPADAIEPVSDVPSFVVMTVTITHDTMINTKSLTRGIITIRLNEAFIHFFVATVESDCSVISIVSFAVLTGTKSNRIIRIKANVSFYVQLTQEVT